jgi:hypothetical protein
MNMNGRRIFKMIQDFAANVAHNLGLASEVDPVTDTGTWNT